MNNSQIEIYQTKDGQTQVDVRFEKETVWLNQEQLSTLFGRDRTVIGRHIRNIFNEGELNEIMVCADFAHTTQHGAISGKTQTAKTRFYNLDVTDTSGKETYQLGYDEAIKQVDFGRKRLADNALVALTLMIAVSKPDEKDVMVKVIVNLINKKN